MRISSKGRVRILTVAIFFVVIIIGAFLAFDGYLSMRQFSLLTYGSVGLFSIINAMINLTADSILLRQRIPITLTIVGLGVLLMIILMFTQIEFLYIFAYSLGLIGIAIGIGLVDWNSKRKHKQTNIEGVRTSFGA